MAHAHPLGLQVLLVLPAGLGLQRDPIHDFEVVAGEPGDFAWIVGQEPHASDAEVVDHLGADAIVPEVGGEPQLLVGLHRVESPILQAVGLDLVRQAENILWFNKIAQSNHLSLKTATSNAAEVLSWSGGMNPYKEGTLGTIEEGGYADIILVDGNPLENLDAILRDNVHFVMKDGLVYKNWLPDENAPAFLPAGPKRDAYFGNL